MFENLLIRLLREKLLELGVFAKENDELSKAGQRYFDVKIIVARKSHKPIVIGKAGSMLENAGTTARKRAQSLLNSKIVLKAKVEIDENWQSNPHYLSS
jgi:GTP-binding protein Era